MGFNRFSGKKSHVAFLAPLACAILTLTLTSPPTAEAAEQPFAPKPAAAADQTPEPIADLSPLLKPGFAVKLGVQAAETQPPAPDCGPKEMLVQQRTACELDPQYIPIEAPAETLRLVNSNIKAGMSNWREDYSKLLSVRPDFLTLQEMANRTDEELAIQGYAIYRTHESPYTRETPVLYDTSRWELVDSGTQWLTVRKVKWGERAINWITVKSKTTGRVVSVVSAHPAPTVKRTEGLLPIFMGKLYPIVESLHERGEVLIGGDFNMHYEGANYWQTGIAQSNLQSTFDVFGKLPTGRYYGATIDYMFSRQSPNLTPTAQGVWRQNSDHNALWSDWALSTSVKLTPVQIEAATLAHNNVKINY